MYLEYWGLSRFPFENVPDPEFMFFSKEHEEALARLLYAAKRKKGLALLTGELGCGKTILSRAFIQQLSEESFDIGLITNPSLEPLDFLKETLNQFGLDYSANTKFALMHLLNEKLLQNVKDGKNTILVIDEAQAIRKDTFEEIRLLLNFQLNDSFLITLILIGQPEFKDMVREFSQFDQRIAIRYHLNALNFEDTTKYIVFRLQKAGRTGRVFTDQSIEGIFNYTQGVPRKINSVCDMILLLGASSKVKLVDVEIVRQVIRDSF